MTINVNHRGLELTPAIRQYVEEKMESLQKYFESIRHIDVEVGIANGHHHKGDIFECKVVVQVGGETIQIAREAEDLYKAIDKVKDHLRMELTEWKKKLEERSKSGGGAE